MSCIYAVRLNTDNWVQANDDRVTPCPTPVVMGETAYMLFYDCEERMATTSDTAVYSDVQHQPQRPASQSETQPFDPSELLLPDVDATTDNLTTCTEQTEATLLPTDVY